MKEHLPGEYPWEKTEKLTDGTICQPEEVNIPGTLREYIKRWGDPEPSRVYCPRCLAEVLVLPSKAANENPYAVCFSSGSFFVEARKKRTAYSYRTSCHVVARFKRSGRAEIVKNANLLERAVAVQRTLADGLVPVNKQGACL
jgi:hypothetical protein